MNIQHASFRICRSYISQLSILALLLFSTQSYAQNLGSITGILKQNSDKEVIPFANIGLLDKNDSVVGVSASNFDGKFIFADVNIGNYSLTISCLGYEPFQQNNIVVHDTIRVDLGEVLLSEMMTKIEEVNVVAEKSMIQQGVGKTILNVGKQIANSGESASELIKYLPSASTDEDNQVLVRGSAATILIDGVNSDLGNPLEALAADAIEKIELITNPSAKYSSQNGSAIINIILKKGKQKGANGRVNFAWGTPARYQAGGNLILKRNKWTSFTTLNYLQYDDEVTSLSEREKSTETENSVLYNNGISERTVKNIDLMQGIKYQINKTSSIRFDGSLKKSGSNNLSFQKSEKIKGDTLRSSYNTNETSSESDKNYYKTLLHFQKEINSLSSLSIIGQYELQDNKSPYEKETKYFDPISEEQKMNYAIQSRNNPERIESQRVKIDLESGLNKYFKLETGALIIVRNSELESDLLKSKFNFDTSSDKYEEVVDSSKMYQFVVDEILPSAYGVLSFEKNKWGLGLGLRYEMAQLESGSSSSDSLAKNIYHNFLPSFQLSKLFGKTTTLSFSATNRTKMPNYKQLNPVEVYNGNYSKSSGNPDLVPENISNFECGIHQTHKKGSINLSFFRKGFNNMITRTQSYEQEGEYEVLNRSYKNIGEVKQLGLDMNISHRMPWKLKIKANFLCMDQSLKTERKGEETSIDDFSYSAKLIANQTFKNGVRWQLTSIYNSPSKTVSGEKYEYYFTNFSIGKSILSKKANITCSVYDIFDTQQRERLDNSSPDYLQYSYTKNISQKVLLAFNYRFNTNK